MVENSDNLVKGHENITGIRMNVPHEKKEKQKRKTGDRHNAPIFNKIFEFLYGF